MQNQPYPILNGVLFCALASGIKKDDALDLSVILLPEHSQTAAVFTKNIFCAAPVLVAKNHLNNKIRALVINSGNANAGTGIGSGDEGLKNAYQTCVLLAKECHIEPEQVLPFSTGVIGEQLPMACFKAHMKTLISKANNTQLELVAKAIMTTDTTTKIVSKTLKFEGKEAHIIGIAKGSGMICPNMATMLSFIITDLACDTPNQLQHLLTKSVDQSFNRITIDGDTSTNDCVTLSATGTSGIEVGKVVDGFSLALNELTQELAQKIVKDGEGATKFIEVFVHGGQSNDDCLAVAYSVAHSPLVKTALFAEDANIGRLLMAVGKAKVEHRFTQEQVTIKLNEFIIVEDGLISQDYTEEKGTKELMQQAIVIDISIGHSSLFEKVWTCDLSYDYVKINAEYRT